MKLTGSRIASYLARAPEEVRVALFHGEDEGLVRERAGVLIGTVLGGAPDPFRLIDLSPSDVREDPARLADEAAALGLGGGRRVIRLRRPGEGIAPSLGDILRDGKGDSLIVIEAGGLAPRSRLRQACDKAPNAVSIACYPDAAGDLSGLIDEVLSAEGLQALPDALSWLCAHLGADRMVTRSELSKLSLYCAGRGTVSLSDARACIGDSAAHRFDDAVHAAALGDFASLDRSLSVVLAAGESPIGLLRAAQGHFRTLHLLAGSVAGGLGLDRALAGLRPPLHFRAADRVRAQMRRWRVGDVERALVVLFDAERACKSADAPAGAIAVRALLKIARAAR